MHICSELKSFLQEMYYFFIVGEFRTVIFVSSHDVYFKNIHHVQILILQITFFVKFCVFKGNGRVRINGKTVQYEAKCVKLRASKSRYSHECIKITSSVCQKEPDEVFVLGMQIVFCKITFGKEMSFCLS